MKTVIINRPKWGEGLLQHMGSENRCCLGFVCVSYGVPPIECNGVGVPNSLPITCKKKLPKWMLKLGSSADVNQAVKINDNFDLTWAQKEELLKPLFLKHKIKLVFHGKKKDK